MGKIGYMYSSELIGFEPVNEDDIIKNKVVPFHGYTDPRLLEPNPEDLVVVKIELIKSFFPDNDCEFYASESKILKFLTFDEFMESCRNIK